MAGSGTNQYDAGDPPTLGLVTSKANPNGESVKYAYDNLGHIVSQQYAGEGGITPNMSFQYDPNGRTARATSSLYGAQTYTYDNDGRLSQANEPGGSGLTNPAQLNYAYYADGAKSALSIVSASLTQANAIAYSYRADGQVQTQQLNAFGGATWSKTYTEAGRRSALAGLAVESFAYDAAGQEISETLLHGNGLRYTYDPEGSVHTTTEIVNGTVYEALNNGVNQRGELYDQTWGPNPEFKLERRGTSTAGYMSTVTIPLRSNTNPAGTPCTDDPDYLNGTRVELACPGAPVSYNAMELPQGSDDSYSFDASGRMTRHVATSDAFSSATVGTRTTNKNTHTVKTTSNVYDAENHLHGVGQSTVKTIYDPDANTTTTETGDHGMATIGWGPNQHPVSAENLWNATYLQPDTTLHWDDDSLLLVTDASGAVVDFKVGIDGEVAPRDVAFTGPIALERGHSGTIIGCTSAGGSSAFIDAQQSAPNGIPCQSGNGYTAPVRHYFPYVRSDGLSGIRVQINGVRAFDTTLGTWTTPDAFEGDVHDPASQQRYMWNRNNPYEYSDPSGFCCSSLRAQAGSLLACRVCKPSAGRNKRDGFKGRRRAAIDGCKFGSHATHRQA